MHPEQEAFEKSIDANPLDATTHLVYADWLDEHDQPDEAAFRRSMGGWMQDEFSSKIIPGTPSGDRQHQRFGVPGYQWGVHVHHMPQWMRTSYGEQFWQPDQAPTDRTRPLLHDLRFWWPSYRDMETAFRRYHAKHRQAQQFSRRVRAMRLSREK